MNFDQFFLEAQQLNINLDFDNGELHRSTLLNNEALFHLPFLAMIILMLAKGQRKPKYSELGQLIGECLERTLRGFKGSSQHIGWSANLRIRTIKALSFLELSSLAAVNQRTKIISATTLGHKVAERASGGLGNLAITLQVIERNYRNICAEKQIEMDLN